MQSGKREGPLAGDQGVISPRPARRPHIRLEARSFGQIILAFSPSKNFSALQQSYDQNDSSDDQKNVDKSADVEREKSQSPQNDQDD